MLADFLLGPLRTRVLSALLLHPQTAWHVRELARRIGALPGSTNRELTKLADAGILSRQKVGNQVHYRANQTCPIFSELAGLLRKTSGIAVPLTDALTPLESQIQSAMIFGSVAVGEENVHSDVDVLVLGETGFAQVVAALHPVQETIGREINPVVYRAADFRDKLKSGNTWAREVMSKPKIFLMGSSDDFAKLVGDSAPGKVQSQPNRHSASAERGSTKPGGRQGRSHQ